MVTAMKILLLKAADYMGYLQCIIVITNFMQECTNSK
jgi:hypothetical protein